MNRTINIAAGLLLVVIFGYTWWEQWREFAQSMVKELEELDPRD
jgi:uncharacterized protein YjeT (DUF2065 family)